MKKFTKFKNTAFFIFITLLVFSSPALAAAPYNASALLGQVDGSDSPQYSQELENNSAPHLELKSPVNTALDTVDHRLFVSDRNYNRVVVYNLDSSNNLVDDTPDNVLGQSTFSTVAAGSGATGFVTPTGLVYDSAGKRLFVSDESHNRVLVFDVTAISNGEAAVNVLGQTNFTSYNSATNQSRMSHPGGLAYDNTTSTLYVADAGNTRILTYDVTAITDGENTVHVLGQANFFTSNFGRTQSLMQNIAGLVIDKVTKQLFVADYTNSRVLVFDVNAITDGEDAVNVLGQDDFTSLDTSVAANRMFGPRGIGYDQANHRLFVPDLSHYRVLVFDVTAITDGEDAVNVLGQPDFTTAVQTSNDNPDSDAVVGPAFAEYGPGNDILYVTDLNLARISVFDTATIDDGEDTINIFGHGTGSNINAKGFDEPHAIVMDSVHHRLFAADYNNKRVLVFNLDSNNNLIDYSADNVLGESDFTSRRSNTPYDQAMLISPDGLAYDSARDLLFVADGAFPRVLVFDTSTITNNENAIHVLGQQDYTTDDSATTINGFDYIEDLAYDQAGQRLFVSDVGNNRIMVFDVSTIDDGEDAVNVLGQTDFITGDDGDGQSKFIWINGMEYDPNRNWLFATDSFNERILVFDVTSITDGEPAIHVLGQPDFDTYDDNVTQTGTEEPSGLAFDPYNNYLFSSAAYQNRLMVYDTTSITDGEPAIAVLGQPDYTTGGDIEDNTQTSLAHPWSVEWDGTNNRLYVGQWYNNRFSIFNLINVNDSTVVDGDLGVPYSATLTFENDQGTSAFNSSVSGTLPPGLTFDDSTGIISGTPTLAGTYNFGITATDSSPIWDFTSPPSNSTIVITGPNSTPTVSTLGPADHTDGSTISDHQPDLTFTTADIDGGDTVKYEIIVDNNSDFSSPLIDYTSALAAPGSSSFSVGQSSGSGTYTTGIFGQALPDDSYYWKVKATDNNAAASAFSVANSGGVAFVIATSSTPSGGSHGSGASGGSSRPVLPATFTPPDPNTPLTLPLPNYPTPVTTPPAQTPPATPSSPSLPANAPAPYPTPSNHPGESETPRPSQTPPVTSYSESQRNSSTTSSPKVAKVVHDILGFTKDTVSYPPIKSFGQVAEVGSLIISALLLTRLLATGIPFSNSISYFFFILPQILGIRRTPKPWGSVYDSQTKRPIPFTRVEILNSESRKLESVITDPEGRYGFLVASQFAGGEGQKIALSAEQKGYTFPSSVVPSTNERILYPNIYQGGLVNTPEDIMNLDLPMDPIKPTLKLAKAPYFGIVSAGFNNFLTHLSKIVFVLGLIFGVISYTISPTTLNLLLLGVVLLTGLLRKSGFKLKSFGMTKDRSTSKSMPFGFIALHDLTGKRINFTVSDALGRYFLLSPKGRFMIKAYTPSHISPMREAEFQILSSKGWVSKEIDL